MLGPIREKDVDKSLDRDRGGHGPAGFRRRIGEQKDAVCLLPQVHLRDARPHHGRRRLADADAGTGPAERRAAALTAGQATEPEGRTCGNFQRSSPRR